MGGLKKIPAQPTETIFLAVAEAIVFVIVENKINVNSTIINTGF
jgi:hypothetical protein